MIEVQRLVKRFGTLTALDGVSLAVGRGEFFGLLGPNGAGKSTLMNCVTGYIQPDEGEIRYAGEVFQRNSHAIRRRFGLVPQQVALYQTLTPVENLRVCGSFYGLSGKELTTRIDSLLDLVQLQDRRKDRVKDFSGGMKRRLNIAASLMHQPEILYCDEPTVGVDPQSRNAIFDMLEHLNAGGMTVVYTTHYMEEVTRLCRRIAVIDHGKLIALGSLSELLALLPRQRCVTFPVDEATAAFAAGTAPRFGELKQGPGGHRHQLFAGEGFDAAAFFSAAQQAGLEPWTFNFEQGTLEDVFLHLTGRTLRD